MNNIKKFRKASGMTQRELAEAVRTSQQQIQRIEAGVQKPRVDVASGICKALGKGMAEVFPQTRGPISRAIKASNSKPFSDESFAADLDKAGLDTDPRVWRFAYRLRGGATGRIIVESSEKDRIWSLIQRTEDSFVVFDGEGRRFALNPAHLLFCQFLFDMPDSHRAEDQDAGKFEFAVTMTDSPEPITLTVDPDQDDLEDDPDAEAPLHSIFIFAESMPEGRFAITDEDGETAFFRYDDVALISASLETVEPKLLAAVFDEQGDE